MGSGGRSRGRTGTITPTVPPARPVPEAGEEQLTPRRRGGAAAARGGGAPAGTGGPIAGAAPGPAAPSAPSPAMTAEDVLAAARAEREAAEAAAGQQRADWGEEEVSYLEDPAAFQQAYLDAMARKEAGGAPVPYMYENATGGLGARNGGRAFGREIEFDFAPRVRDKAAALRAIGRDLVDAGLSRHPFQAGYHASLHAGYTDDPTAWRLESDSTVAGEIVSPIMYDEPQTWRNLEKVCDIVKRHGGIPSARTGGHTHVAVPDFDHTVENHNRLLAMADGYNDTIYRLAQNPKAARHRGTDWCRPNTVPATGYTSIAGVRQANNSHHIGVNFGSVLGQRADHVEWRMWDGSLEPGVIQAQIKLSLGLTAAAVRGGSRPPARERVGTHRSRLRGRSRLAGEAWRENTRSFRELADSVFRRAADKAQAAALFAVTRWQEG
jgi:hypothetical protein